MESESCQLRTEPPMYLTRKATKSRWALRPNQAKSRPSLISITRSSIMRFVLEKSALSPLNKEENGWREPRRLIEYNPIASRNFDDCLCIRGEGSRRPRQVRSADHKQLLGG